MKKKFIVLTLCFTILFTSINYKKSYANPLLAFTPQFVATVATIAVGAGITLSSDDDIRDIVRIFYNSHKAHWQDVENVFKIAVSIGANKVVTVQKEFLDLCKSAFDGVFLSADGISGLDKIEFSSLDIPIQPAYTEYDYSAILSNLSIEHTFSIGSVVFKTYPHKCDYMCSNYNRHDISYDVLSIGGIAFEGSRFNSLLLDKKNNGLRFSSYVSWDGRLTVNYSGTKGANHWQPSDLFLTSAALPYSLPYKPGSYDWDKVKENQKENGDVGLYVPGNAGSLVGQPGGSTVEDGVNNPAYDLPLAGDVTIPKVDNPSLDIADSVPFPGVIEGNPSIPKPPIDGTLPPFPNFGDGLDFSPMYMTNINEKFPFSLPWDIGRLIGTLDAPSKAPIFKVPVPYTKDGFTVDFTMFEELAVLVRFFAIFGFIITLILLSTKLLG